MSIEKIENKDGDAPKLEPAEAKIKLKITRTRMWQYIAGFFFLTTLFLLINPVHLFGSNDNDENQKIAQQQVPTQQNPGNENNNDKQPEVKEQERFDVGVDDDPSMGDENAPVTIVAFEDYQCPFCQRVHATAFPQIKKEYIDTGKVRFVFRDFPLAQIHPEAVAASEASECADEQGKFWEYHDFLYANQHQLGSELYMELARELELDLDTFTTCIENREQEYEVQNDFAQGVEAGVDGTPAYFINGIKIVGSHPFENFKEIIESELGEN